VPRYLAERIAVRLDGGLLTRPDPTGSERLDR